MSAYTTWSHKIFSTLGVLLHVLFIDIPSDLYRWMTLSEKNVAGHVVVVTGAASGLGRRMAYLLAVERKAKVALIDTDENALREAIDEIESAGGDARSWRADITDANLMDTVAGEIEIELGPVDIVICNAAVLHFGLFLDIPTHLLQRAIDVNIMGTINTIRSFLFHMEKRKRGHIVAVSSIAGFTGETYGLAYCPTKFAVRGVMDCLQMEMRDRGLNKIMCTTLCPYFARTPMILNVGMRPTSTWFPFMSINTCAKQMISAILQEQILAFVPSYITCIAMGKQWVHLKLLVSMMYPGCGANSCPFLY